MSFTVIEVIDGGIENTCGHQHTKFTRANDCLQAHWNSCCGLTDGVLVDNQTGEVLVEDLGPVPCTTLPANFA